MGFFGRLFGGSDEQDFLKRLRALGRASVGKEMSTDVMTIRPDESLIDAANIMIGEHISCLVVVEKDSDEPIGILTERDFLLHPPEKQEELKEKVVEDIMTNDPVTVQPSLLLFEASKLMDKHKFRKLVVTEDDSLVGILTQTDLVRRMDNFYRSFRFKTSDSLSVKAVKKEALTVDVEDTVSDAHELMVDEETGSIFVMEDDNLRGAFTEFDFLSQLAINPEEMFKMEMGEVMSWPLVGIEEEVDLFDANTLMLQKDFRRLPVFENREMVGKVTQTTIRKNGFEIFDKSLERAGKDKLEEVNFQRLKKRRPLVREIIQDKVQEFRYPESSA